LETFLRITRDFVDSITGNLKKHTTCLEKLKGKQCEGEASLQNALEVTSQSLRLDIICIVHGFTVWC